MAMPWVRLENNWHQNPKFLHLAEDKKWRAITVYMAGLGWAGGQGQDGFVPKSALPMLHGSAKEAQQLVEVALWIPAPGGWQINDWSEYQPTSMSQQARSNRARDAARARWGTK